MPSFVKCRLHHIDLCRCNKFYYITQEFFFCLRRDPTFNCKYLLIGLRPGLSMKNAILTGCVNFLFQPHALKF